MKNTLAALLLGAAVLAAPACSSPATQTLSPTQEKVSAYLKKTLDDPASYQPVSWGRVTPWQQREVDADNAVAETAEYEHLLEMAKIQTESMARLNEIDGVDAAAFERPKKATKVYLARADSVQKLVQKLEASADTTRLGMSVRHTFRAKNKVGALVLDSARFIVTNDGGITALK